MALLFLVCIAVPANAQRGILTRDRNLSELVDQSAVIVRGRVVSAVLEPHPQFPHLHTVLVTVRVEETLKGAVGASYTFRQFVWEARDRLDAAGYRKGQHLLLLMNPSTPIGITSPSGIEQGRFRIARNAAGLEVAVNGTGNRSLFRGMDAQLSKKGIKLSAEMSAVVSEQSSAPLTIDNLRQLIRELSTPRGVK